MRVVGILIGAICGWLASYVFIALYAYLAVQGPERGMPAIGPFILYWSIVLLSILLGAIVGYAVTKYLLQRRVAEELKSNYRVGWLPFVAIGIMIAILAITVGLPMQERAFRRAASARWKEERAPNAQLAQVLLAEWKDEANAAKIAPQLEELFGKVTLDQSEFSQATSQWSESDWIRFAQLAAEKPERFNAFDDILWAKAKDLSIAESSREKFALACFEFSLDRNYVPDFWTRAMAIPKSDTIWKNLLLAQLQFESERLSNDIPRWLYNSPTVDVLEQLSQHHGELVPHLKKVLSRTQTLIGPAGDSTNDLHQRLEKLTR
jgi:hypothetical protein